MVDLAPFLEAPFEDASNRSFEALLLLGVALLVVVAVIGRSPLTMAIVGLYLLAVPGYVAFRARADGTGIEPSDEENSRSETAADDGASENRSTDSTGDDA